MSNKQLADLLDSHTAMVVDALLSLRRQHEELAARIAFIAPTDADIAREVDQFIASSTQT